VKKRSQRAPVKSMLQKYLRECATVARQPWQPAVAEVAAGLDFLRTKMLPPFGTLTIEEAEAAYTVPFDPEDEEGYLLTAVGVGEIIATNVFKEQFEKCDQCAMNVGLLVVRVAEREGLVVIADRVGQEGPGNPFSMVLPVGGVVSPRTDRPIADHGAWFSIHNHHTRIISGLGCEQCVFGARS
jgi:hypothetical protein